MLRQKSIAAVVVAALVQVTVFSDPAVAKPAAQKRDEQVRAAIIKMEIAPDTRIHVKLSNGSTVAGYLSVVREHAFFVTEPETHTSTQVPYRNVRQINATSTSGMNAMLAVAGVAFMVYWICCGSGEI